MKYNQIDSVYQTYLENGTQVLVLPIQGSKSSVIVCGYAAGAFYEKGFGPGSNDGISHFLEHMIFKGTPKISSGEINEKFTRLGADTNAFTNYDRTFYYSKVPAKNLRAATEIWSELFNNFTLVSEEFNSERKVILQEIKMYEDMPNMYCGWKSRANLYKGTVLAHDIGGSQESVGGITEAMMKAYHTQYYSPENTTVLITGDINWPEINKLIESNFDVQPRVENKRDDSWKNFPTTQKPNSEYEINPGKQALSYIGMSWEIPGVLSEHYYPLLLLNTLIGNSKTSLLYKELVSKGICSTVAYGPELFPPRSSGTITFSCPPEQVATIYETIHKKIFQKIQNLTFTPDMVQKLKEEIRGGMIIASDDPLVAVISLFDKYIKHNEVVTMEESLKRFEKVTVGEMNEARDSSFSETTFSVYAMGTIPKDWTPDLHL